MKRLNIISSLLVVAVIGTGCEDKGKTVVREITQPQNSASVATANAPQQKDTQGMIDMHGGKDGTATQTKTQSAKQVTGTVLETLDADPYTYLLVKTQDTQIWVAVPKIEVKKGTEVTYTENLRMTNFKSKTLGRTFDVVVFANEIHSDSPLTPQKVENPHVKNPHGTQMPKKEVVDVKTPPKPEGALRVSEVYAQRKSLDGQTVKVAGTVVKVLEGIMGKNWIHIQDGTGEQGSDDLIFTSADALPKVGAEVIASGKVKTDQDLGYGYFFSVIVEDANFTER